jgi:hypothetical protein
MNQSALLTLQPTRTPTKSKSKNAKGYGVKVHFACLFTFIGLASYQGKDIVFRLIIRV